MVKKSKFGDMDIDEQLATQLPPQKHKPKKPSPSSSSLDAEEAVSVDWNKPGQLPSKKEQNKPKRK